MTPCARDGSLRCSCWLSAWSRLRACSSEPTTTTIQDADRPVDDASPFQRVLQLGGEPPRLRQHLRVLHRYRRRYREQLTQLSRTASEDVLAVAYRFNAPITLSSVSSGSDTALCTPSRAALAPNRGQRGSAPSDPDSTVCRSAAAVTRGP